MSNFFGVFFSSFFFLLFGACQQIGEQQESVAFFQLTGSIPVPKGYERIKADSGSFAYWLRHIRLKEDNHVYLYNGSLKENQSAHFAVLDIPVGQRDLQQCADAVMRLRAEYLFEQKRYHEIVFFNNNRKEYRWTGKEDRVAFEKYLMNVFNWCGTASLENQLKEVRDINEIKAGDVFIRGGYPGHAMIVTDVAINDAGKKIFMLAQSYMPAQDIHIVRNPLDDQLSPWYEAGSAEMVTPEWVFRADQLKQWE